MRDHLADLALLDGVPSAVAAGTAAVDAVLTDRGLRRVPAESRAWARAEAARASAALTDDPERWQAGALRLAVELDQLAALILVAPGQALARAHLLAGRGTVPDGRLGRPVEGAEGRQRDLAQLLVAGTSASGVVLAAVVHAEIVDCGMFGPPSGLVARAAERMVLQATGVDPAGLLPVEVGHAAAGRPAYREALAGYATGSPAGVAGWIGWCARALAEAAERWGSGRGGTQPTGRGTAGS